MRKIYFRFDIESDTALSVATEMVGELDITDHDVTMIAEMIDSEMISLVPEWRPGVGITEDAPGHPAPAVCHNCASNVSSADSLVDLSPNSDGAGCSRLECAAAMHGRFEEITYRIDGPEHSAAGGRRSSVQLSDMASLGKKPSPDASVNETLSRKSLSELDYRDGVECSSSSHPPTEAMLESLRLDERRPPSKSFARCEGSAQTMFAGKNFYGGLLPLPNGLHRAKSLPIDAVDA